MPAAGPRKYQLPDKLTAAVTQQRYERWLRSTAMAHVRRDKRRGNPFARVEAYKLAIHAAVLESGGKDSYTGEDLDWTLLGKYNNVQSKAGRRGYKATLARKPTIDHVGDGSGEPDFKICGWRTNDAKGDMSYSEFVDLCRKVLRHSVSLRR